MSTPATHFPSAMAQRDAARLGMWTFLASELLFFGPLFMAYLYGRIELGAAFAAASRHTDVILGTVNTAVLLTSSLTMALAVDARRRGPARNATRLLVVTALLGLAFLTIKGLEYRSDWLDGLVPGMAFRFAEPWHRGAEFFFYLYFIMTGLHALHLTIGVVIMLTLAVLTRHRPGAAGPRQVEIAGLYWHFVDIVWIVLYPLLYLVGRAS